MGMGMGAMDGSCRVEGGSRAWGMDTYVGGLLSMVLMPVSMGWAITFFFFFLGLWLDLSAICPLSSPDGWMKAVHAIIYRFSRSCVGCDVEGADGWLGG